MRAERVQSGLHVVGDVAIGEGEDAAQVGAALARGLAREVAAPGMRVLAEGNDTDAPLRAWLEAGGWTVATSKLVVDRRAPFPDGPVPEGHALRSLAAMGEEEFAAAMDRAAEGDPFEHEGPRDALQELRDLARLAGDRFDPAAWFALVDGDGHVAGVVLPQTWEGPGGTLYYIAVTPEFRRRGLGRALHALGLRLLGERGAERYVGSTDTRNEAMVRIFERNGCTEIARQVFYEAAPGASPGPPGQ